MPTLAAPKDDDAELQCMEVWGGNGTRANHFSRPGIDIWLNSQAVDSTVSGGSDLYLLSSCSSGRITRMLVAEVCGHLHQYAKLSDELSELMKKNINTIRQSHMVSELSSRLSEGSEQGCFATTILGTFFSPTRSFTLCNAGNPPPLVYDSLKRDWSMIKRVPTELGPARASAGVTSFEEYQNFETKLNEGDLVLCMSNPITECRSADGTTIGMDGVLDRVRQFDPAKPAELITALTEEIKREHPDNLAIENATVLLCQGTKSGVPWKDNLLAPLRLFQRATDKTTFK